VVICARSRRRAGADRKRCDQLSDLLVLGENLAARRTRVAERIADQAQIFGALLRNAMIRLFAKRWPTLKPAIAMVDPLGRSAIACSGEAKTLFMAGSSGECSAPTVVFQFAKAQPEGRDFAYGRRHARPN